MICACTHITHVDNEHNESVNQCFICFYYLFGWFADQHNLVTMHLLLMEKIVKKNSPFLKLTPRVRDSVSLHKTTTRAPKKARWLVRLRACSRWCFLVRKVCLGRACPPFSIEAIGQHRASKKQQQPENPHKNPHKNTHRKRQTTIKTTTKCWDLVDLTDSYFFLYIRCLFYVL